MRIVNATWVMIAYLVLACVVSCGGNPRDSAEANDAAALDAAEASAHDARNGDFGIRDVQPHEGRADERDDARADHARDGLADCASADVEDASASLDAASDAVVTDNASGDMADAGPGRDAGADPVDVSVTAADATWADQRAPFEGATVDHGPVRSLSVRPGRSPLGRGNATWLETRAVYADGSSADVSDNVSLVSSNPAVVQLERSIARARSLGTATITATLDGVAATTEVTVIPNIIVSVAVRFGSQSGGPNCQSDGGAHANATATMSDGSTLDITSAVTWTSSDPSVIVMQRTMEGVRQVGHCLSPGQAVISATAVVSNVTFDGGSPIADGPLGDVRGEVTAVVAGAPVVGYLLRGPAVLTPGSTASYRVVALYAEGHVGSFGLPAAVLSTDPTVVTVTGYEAPPPQHRLEGLATIINVQARAAGSTVLSATFAGVQTPSLTVTVTSAELQSIAITPETLELTLPAYGRLAAMGTFADGTKADLTTTATWSHGLNSGVLVISGTGTHSITAAWGAITSAPTVVTVRAGQPLAIGIDVGYGASTAVRESFSHKPSAYATYDNPNRFYDVTSDVAWAVRDASVATFAGTVLVGRNAGTTVYSAALAGVTSEPRVLSVIPAATLLSLRFDQPMNLPQVGSTRGAAVWGAFADTPPAEAYDTLVTLDAVFTIDNPQIATVSNDVTTRGLVRAVGIGTTSLTAVVHGVSVTAPVVVGPP